MITKDFSIPSTDNEHTLYIKIWEPSENQLIKGVVQISHGMIDHINRYESFASCLTAHGYAVIGNDHLGHGNSVPAGDDFGFFSDENPSKTVVNDIYNVTKFITKTYPDIPLFLLGHSMGSFLARRYLMQYGNMLQGAILSGTRYENKPTMIMLSALLKLFSYVFGSRYKSSLLNKIIMGGYNRNFKPNRTASDWLSNDETVVNAYCHDPLCDFIFSFNGYRLIVDTFEFINRSDNINLIPKSLPILFIAGDKDPVGRNGKDIKKISTLYTQAGIEHVSVKLYKNDRHEVLNEVNKDTVYADVLAFIQKHR